MQILAGLLPDPTCLNLVAVVVGPDEQRLEITVTAAQSSAACPACGHSSQRIHSRYRRVLADLPWAGLPARLLLHVRRWFCDEAACPRRIFTERLPHVVPPRGRRTKRLASAQQRIGLALGGAAGARLAATLAMPAGINLLLALVRTAPVSQPSTSPHVGIDDWAKRKAHHYGTIIVDLDTGKPITLLDDRSADQVANWLREHPEIRVVSRDRGQVYVEGAARGAPQAVHVADRWHVLKNLGEALLQIVQKHQRTIAEALEPPRSADTPASTSAPAVQLASVAQPTAPVLVVSAADQRRQARYDAIQELQQRGWSQRAIAEHLHLERKTVRTYLRMGAEVTPRRRTPRSSRLEPFKPDILERWNGGCHNAMQILRELQAKGFTGQHSIVRAFLTQLRKAQGLPPRSRSTQSSACSGDPTSRAPSVRTLTWLVIKRDVKLSDDERHLLKQLTSTHADIAVAVELTQQFTSMVRERKAEQLDEWLRRAETSGLRAMQSFAAGVRQDLSAVRAALSLPWSQGPVEGQVNRLKLLKRQMYGRAKLDLLQQRFLAG